MYAGERLSHQEIINCQTFTKDKTSNRYKNIKTKFSCGGME